jgi:hypothetical protein
VFGIVAQGAALRLMGNDVIETSAAGSRRAIGIEVRGANGSFVERIRISNAAIAAGATGSQISSGDANVTVIPVLHDLDNYRFGAGHGYVKGLAAEQRVAVVDLLEAFKGVRAEDLIVNAYDTISSSP